ncbi:MAG TPA: lipopolysaccharide assembly protein LapB [Wenzhouxiangella sp.]|nr:lipopolysaccharide assembly protein LapB [Wenzhouxiangella sp.]
MAESVVLAFLLVLAAGCGWFLASRHQRRRRSHVSRDYFRGLNYLLNEQPDKAVEVFLDLVEFNPDAVETYMALGSLFRRRGEIDRAIRFHKHIISRSGLDEQQRTRALRELGEDYMQAGLLDRAEQLFSRLAEENRQDERSARQLLTIYQQEKDWHKAIEQAGRLRQIDGRKSAEVIASLYCELADSALRRKDRDRTRQYLRQARRYDPDNARARIIEAGVATSEGRWSEAAGYYQQACEIEPDYLSFACGPMLESHRRAGRLDEFDQWLEESIARRPMTTAILALARRKAASDPDRAADFLLEHLSSRPTVHGLDYLLDLVYRQQDSLDRVGSGLIQDILRRLLDNQPRYRCRHCGFSSSTWHWHCPGCRRWNTTAAVTGVLGE